MIAINIAENCQARYEHFSIENKNLAVLISGFATPIKYFSPSISYLQKKGYSVLAIEYDRSVLDTGKPENLLRLVEELTNLVQSHAESYEDVYICGSSLGSFMAFNVMQGTVRPCKGLFGAGGIPVSYAVFHAKRFAKIKQAFLDNGYDERKLLSAWKGIETTPDYYLSRPSHPFIIYSTKLDRVVSHKVAQTGMSIWQERGMPVELKTIKMPGHIAISLWFMRNVGKLVVRDRAAKLSANS